MWFWGKSKRISDIFIASGEIRKAGQKPGLKNYLNLKGD